jgi:RNA polymerase sigma-54 factor
MIELEFEQTFASESAAQQTQKISARLVATSYILELSSHQLQQAIATELNDNPALELVDVPTCQVCGSELHGSICPVCIQRQKSNGQSESADDNGSNFDDVPERRDLEDDDYDPLVRVAAEQTLAETLSAELGAVLSDADLAIAEYLIGSLDDKGFLRARLEDIAYELETDVGRVEAVLRVLQAQDPVGIGARSVRECLLIQIDHLEQRGISQPHVRDIVSQFLTELGEHKFGRIARELSIPPRSVSDAWEFVKQKLNPHPAQGLSATNASGRETRAMYIRPDVIITKGVDGFEVDVVESRRFALRVSPLYARLVADLRRNSDSMSAEEKAHVQKYAWRAKLFMSNVNQRRQTLLKITTCIVERQPGYLEHGVRLLQPLNRADIALQLGLHESTVSRAAASKYAMLPNGEVVPFSHFFTPNLGVKDIMKELIEREGKQMTDADIVEGLKVQGIHLARRTVAKYRTALHILPSGLR